MNRKTALVLRLLFCFAVASHSAGADGGATTKPRYVLPSDGKPGRIQLDQYFRIADPVEASRLLLQEAQLAGLDPDRKDERSFPEILLPSGPMTPDPEKNKFLRAYQSSQMKSPNEHRMTLLKFSRPPTIREFASILSHGTRLYRGIPHLTYVAYIPPSAVEFLSGLPVLEWTGDYSPSYKYDPAIVRGGNERVLVFSLPGDEPECRQDLEQLGAVIEGVGDSQWANFEYRLYETTVSHDLIPRIAELWWVQKIELRPLSGID